MIPVSFRVPIVQLISKLRACLEEEEKQKKNVRKMCKTNSDTKRKNITVGTCAQKSET